MRFIDFFAGIGGFRMGLELSGHQCVGFCEWDKFAAASYTSMHLITEDQRKNLEKISVKQRQKEILKEEYRNGEWYSNDIRAVHAGDIPESECWTFGAPCQDFSIAGKRAGLEGDRSSLVREVFRLLEEQEDKSRPEWLIYENVKGMLSSNRGLDYLSILSEMDRLGYDIQWQNINSKWWIPQNRERIYTIGHIRKRGSAEIFPITGTDGENSVHQIASQYCANRNNPQRMRTYDTEGIASCLNCMERGNQEPHIGVKVIGTTRPSRNSASNIHDINGCCSTLLSRDYKGPQMVAIPILTPEREEKRQNGRRFKENGDPMFTLTAQDRHGVAIEILGCLKTVRSEYGKSIRKDYESGKLKISRHKFLNYSIRTDGCCNTIDTVQKDNYIAVKVKKKKPKGKEFRELREKIKSISRYDKGFTDGIYVEMPGGFLTYCVWYEKYQCYIAIRKLTPKECFRLQGWSDDYFEKAAFVNSDSQLYKQAGNGVTVDVVREIGRKIKMFEEKRKMVSE